MTTVSPTWGRSEEEINIRQVSQMMCPGPTQNPSLLTHAKSCAIARSSLPSVRTRRSSLPSSPEEVHSVHLTGGCNTSTSCFSPIKNSQNLSYFYDIQVQQMAPILVIIGSFLENSHWVFISLFFFGGILIYSFMEEIRDNLKRMTLTWLRKPKWNLSCISVLFMLRYAILATALYESKLYVMEQTSS